MAVLAGPNEKLDAAKFFENADKPQFDKAVILYEKAGYVGKALDLAFETKQHNVLQYIGKTSEYPHTALRTVRTRTPHTFLKFYRTPHYFRTSKKVEKPYIFPR